MDGVLLALYARYCDAVHKVIAYVRGTGPTPRVDAQFLDQRGFLNGTFGGGCCGEVLGVNPGIVLSALRLHLFRVPRVSSAVVLELNLGNSRSAKSTVLALKKCCKTSLYP